MRSQGVTRPPFGEFVGNVDTRWITVDRDMLLLADFSYIDPSEIQWTAKKDSRIDGASIPRALWTVVGSPFTGAYRSASVVHDVACVLKDRPWEAVHRMFYNAMRCGGVGEKRALFMYAAVYRFGPRWKRVPNCAGVGFGGGTTIESVSVPVPSVDGLQALQASIEQESQPMTLEDVERLVRR